MRYCSLPFQEVLCDEAYGALTVYNRVDNVVENQFTADEIPKMITNTVVVCLELTEDS